MDGKSKTCFVLTPIGDDNSPVRRETDGLIDAVIEPVLKELGFGDIAVSHRMPKPGSITNQIIKRVLNDDLVVANLTHLNPNVMYELAIRHAARKPVIHLCQIDTKLPFDIVQERAIFYQDDMKGVMELSKGFKEMVEKALVEKKPDNPIYRVIEKDLIIQKMDTKEPLNYLLERMDRMDENFTSFLNQIRINQSLIINPKPVNNSNQLGNAYTTLINPDTVWTELTPWKRNQTTELISGANVIGSVAQSPIQLTKPGNAD